jgi:sugar phosphate isomerase/epimerase
MEPIFGVYGMYDVIRNDQGEFDFELYTERVANLGQKYGFVPTSIVISDRDVGGKTKDKGYVREMRARLDELNLRPFASAGPLVLGAKKWEQEESLEQCIANLEFCAGLGGNLARTHPRFHGRVGPEGRMSAAIDLLTRLADAADDYGLIVCLEDYEFWVPADFERLFAYCDRENLGIINDTGNWLINGVDPLMATRQLEEWIVGVHLKNYTYELGYWRSRELGRGMVNVERVLEAMWDLPRPYPLLMPVETDVDDVSELEAQDQSLAYLREVVDRIQAARGG